MVKASKRLIVYYTRFREPILFSVENCNSKDLLRKVKQEKAKRQKALIRKKAYSKQTASR